MQPLGGYDPAQGIREIFQGFHSGAKRRQDKRDRKKAEELFINEQSKKNLGETAIRYFAGEDPNSLIAERADFVLKQGGDPSDTLELANVDPDVLKKRMKAALAYTRPDMYQQFFPQETRKINPDLQKFDRWQSMPEGEEKQALGRMLGLNKETAGQKPKGFTLSEGQARYDSEGNLLAEREKTINQLENEIKKDKSQFEKAAKIRGEIEKVNSAFRRTEDAYDRITATVDGKPTGASDMALIFNYMKMLDPASTVMQGEYANAAQTGGIPATVVNLYNKAIDGEMLTPTQRRNFIDQSKRQFDKALKTQNRRMSEYQRLGERYGIERGEIILTDKPSSPLSDQDLDKKYGILE